MIRLAAFDIDRTLLSQATQTIAPETISALRTLQQNGIKTAIATGRQWQQIPKVLKQLDFDYYILLNGTNIMDRSGNLLFRQGLDLEDARILEQEFLERDWSLYLRFVGGMYPVLSRDREVPFGLTQEEIPEELLEGLLMQSPMEWGEAPLAALGQMPKGEARFCR